MFLVLKRGLDIYLSFRFLLISFCGVPGRQSQLLGPPLAIFPHTSWQQVSTGLSLSIYIYKFRPQIKLVESSDDTVSIIKFFVEINL